MIIDLNTLEPADIYRTMIQCVVPRPIAWVVSDNGNGSQNLAPFSFFNGVSSAPPLISISIGRKRDGSPKDTWRNISERSHFTLNIPSVIQADKVSGSADPLPFGESEADLHGVELVELPGFSCPRVSDAPVAFACQRHQIIEIGDTPMGLILGRITSIYVDDTLITDNAGNAPKIDTMGINPLARLGGDDYASLSGAFTVVRNH